MSDPVKNEEIVSDKPVEIVSPLMSSVGSGTVRRYGWKRGVKLNEDRQYHMQRGFDAKATLPALVDLRSKMPPVYDQGELGSCTSQASSAVYSYTELTQNKKDAFTPSRLFLYYNERVIDGTVGEDAGSTLRTGMISINKDGMAPEPLWPYIISKFTMKPSSNVYKVAKKNRSIEYMRVAQDLYELKHCLATYGPIVFGFQVHASFESDAVAKTGMVPIPKPGEDCLGGHAVALVGYDDSKQVFIVRNSWGAGWGDKGYFYLPYAFVLRNDLCDDFWCLKVIM